MPKINKMSLKGRFLSASMLSGVAALSVAPVQAQDGDAGDTIVVTGTRIARDDLAAPSPITRVESEQLVLTNTVNAEQFLNTLPQVIPSLDSTSNNPGNGTATVNLRGLGSQRTLVLVDGTRFVASGPGGVVDINNIPAALVDRIEVVTGGASAVYGSDAVAGVVNFILKDDFEGIQLDVSDELSASGWDANIFNVALTMGGNFADGRGNAVFSMSYTNRESLLQGQRGFSSDSLFDPGPGGTEFLTGGSGNALGGQFISLGANDFSASYPCVDAPPQFCSGNVTFGGASPNPDGRRYINPQDQYNYAPVNYLQLPQERYSIYGGGSYEINDNIEAYARGIFASSIVDNQLAATPIGGTFILPLDNPNIPAPFLNALLAAYTGPGDIADLDGDGAADDVAIFIARRYNDEVLGPRNSLRDTSAFQLQVGLRGDLSENWSYDAFFQFGRSSATQTQSGNISFSALSAGITDGTCNVFGVNTLSQACAESITRTGIISNNVEQTQFVGTLTGVIPQLRLPGAEDGVALAVGVEYREEFAEFNPDSVLGPDVRGFNASLPVQGRYDVYEVFMETEIPVIQDQPFFKELNINGAYRYSDYSTPAVGGVHTFSAGLEWVPVEGLRFRGQFQRAARAPNINELFSTFSNGFPGAQDPCAGGTFGSFVPGNAATCAAYGVPVPGAPFQLSGQIETLFGGNPDLFQETADTLTIGAVWQPAAVEGLVLQVDYYDVDIDDAITNPVLQLLLDRCYVQGNTQTCDIYFGPGTREPATGRIGAPYLTSIPALNVANFTASGIDFQASYGFDLGGSLGSVSLIYYGNYTIESSFQLDADADIIDCAGVYGGNCGEPTPEYKHTMQVGWNWDRLTTSVRWRLIGGVDADPSVFPPGNPTIGDLSDNIDMYNYLDVTLQYEVNENLDLTVGVQNITGKDAPLLGSTVNEQANTWPATYETLGRQLFMGASIRF